MKSLLLGMTALMLWGLPNLSAAQTTVPKPVPASQETEAAPKTGMWTEVKSSNFVVRQQSSKIDAASLVRDLELFRAAMLHALGAGSSLDATPVRIFIVNPEPENASLFPYAGFTVLSQSDLDGPVFLINSAAPARGKAVLHKILQDYARHLIAANAPDQFPYWLQTGLADYWAGSKIGREGVMPGQPIEKHILALGQGKWVPMKAVLSAMHSFHSDRGGEGAKDEIFQQAQAWAAARYIFSSPELALRVPSYLARLDAGAAPNKAFKKAFGMSAKKFEKRVKRAARSTGPSLSGEGMKPTADSEVDKSPLSAAAAALAYGEVLRIFAYSAQGYAAADQLYSHAGPGSAQKLARAQTYAGRADIAFAQDNIDAASALMAKAITSAPRDAAIQKRAGGMYAAQFEESRETKWLVRARDHFARALSLSPSDPAASFHFASICGKIECPQEDARAAAINAMRSYKDAQYIGMLYGVVPVLRETGEHQILREFAARAAIWGEDAGQRQGAKALWADIDMDIKKAP